MSEITKLYENAGVLKECLSPCYINKTWRKTHDCPNCDNRENYPPFTAEKQLELIKYIASKGLVQINYWSNNCYTVSRFGCTGDENTEFSEALANVIAKDWKNLCKEQQEEIRKILKG